MSRVAGAEGCKHPEHQRRAAVTGAELGDVVGRPARSSSGEPSFSELVDAAKASDDWDPVCYYLHNLEWPVRDGFTAAEEQLDLAVRCEASIEAPTPISRRQIDEAVRCARHDGSSWERIAELLGSSVEDAQDAHPDADDPAKYAAVVARVAAELEADPYYLGPIPEVPDVPPADARSASDISTTSSRLDAER